MKSIITASRPSRRESEVQDRVKVGLLAAMRRVNGSEIAVLYFDYRGRELHKPGEQFLERVADFRSPRIVLHCQYPEQSLSCVTVHRTVDAGWYRELHVTIVHEQHAGTVRQERNDFDLDADSVAALPPGSRRDFEHTLAMCEYLLVADHVVGSEGDPRTSCIFPSLYLTVNAGGSLYEPEILERFCRVEVFFQSPGKYIFDCAKIVRSVFRWLIKGGTFP